MISILTWVSIFSGGLLIVLLLISIIGGFDFDMDIGSTDVEADAGGLGLLKGVLTFVSVSSWIIKILMVSNQHPGLAIGVGIVSGIVAFLLLNALLKFLIQNEENVNWSMEDALQQKGEVYLKIPAAGGNGIVQVNVKGALRELKAKSANLEEIETGASIIVVEVEGEYVRVQKETEKHLNT